MYYQGPRVYEKMQDGTQNGTFFMQDGRFSKIFLSEDCV